MKGKLLPATHKSLVSLLLFPCFYVVTYGQTVSGKVSDAAGKALSRVSLTLKGASTGTTTDGAGQFKIIASSNAVLLFSSVGYNSLDVAVSGRTTIDVVFTDNAVNMNEVVITALGISKQARSIGYAATNVKAEELTINRTPNLMNALQGKVAGVNISGLGTGPAGTSKIRIRGQSSISGQNNPLIVNSFAADQYTILDCIFPEWTGSFCQFQKKWIPCTGT